MLRKMVVGCVCGALLSACKTLAPASVPAPLPWVQRVVELQHAGAWTLDGRVAVALGSQGWQATLNWQQRGAAADVRLAGPLGVGAVRLNRTPEGVSVNGAPPSAAALAQVQERLGFELPLDDLRFWLRGVPDPGAPSELTRNAQDRAAHLAQAGWSVDYDRYMPADGDLLPAHLVLTRNDVRVRVAVDHWIRLP